MGQKVNPIGNRLGIIKGWDSNWYGGKDFSGKLVEDTRIREYLNARLAKASISKIVIERTLKLITVTVNTARPGIIIGKGVRRLTNLRKSLRRSPRRKFRSISSRLSVRNLMPTLSVTILPARLRVRYHTAGPSKCRLHRP